MTDHITHPFWEALSLPAPGTAMTTTEYHALPETMIPMEYIDGRVVYPHWSEKSMSPTPRARHQYIVTDVSYLLRDLIPNGRVVVAPMDVRMGGKTVQPDVFWVAAGGACVDKDTYLEGPPGLTVEVLSPGNTSHDRITKFNLYEQQGVREYWIIDPDEDIIEVYTQDDSTFKRVGAYQPGNTFQSPVLGQLVPVDEMFTT